MSLAAAFNYFANSLWQVPLLACCCWCALRLAKASPQVQYAAGIVALLLCAGLPLRGAPPATATVMVTEGGVQATTDLLHEQAAPSIPFYTIHIEPHTRDVMAELYLGLTLLLGLRLLSSHLALRRLVRIAALHPLSAAAQNALTALYGDAVPARVLACAEGTPMVAGLWRPVVLLPASVLEGDRETLRAVLAHEIAHLRRRDTLANFALRLVTLPIGYHPAAVFLHRRVRHARELICDAAASSAMPSRGAYAQVLLRLARQLLPSGSEASRDAAGLFERTSKPLLEERIMNLVAPPTPSRRAAQLLRYAAGISLFGTAAAAVSMVHLTPAVMAAERPVQPASVMPILAASPSSAQDSPVPSTHSQVVPGQGVSTKQTGRRPAAKPEEISDVAAAVRASVLSAKTAEELTRLATELQAANLTQQIADLEHAKVETAEARRELDQRRALLNSPEFKKQMADAKAQMVRASRDIEASKEQMETLSKQMNSPDFQRKVAAGKGQPVQMEIDMPKLMADAKEASLLTHSYLGRGSQDEFPAQVSAGVMAGQIKTKVQPIYPPEAKAAHIGGSVVMRATIGTDGKVSSLKVASGPQELQASALDAVRQWVYQPFLLNGQPTAVDTTITVTYSLPN